MKKLVLILAVFVAQPALAEIRSCDMDSTMNSVSGSIMEALNGLYAIQGQALDQNEIRISRAKDIAFDQHGNKSAFAAVDVSYISPRGTKLSLKSTKTTLFSYADPQETLASLGYSFAIVKERDAEGFLVKKTCQVFPEIKPWIYQYGVAVINEVNGVIAPISKDLWEKIPNSEKSPMELLSLSLPMTLEE